ncbi:hypothetical protein BDL97_09G043900 [Sphagnum fallax]|nr:hypothetical protein BDL97_09G043900 [Sphagnum fallax]
MDPHQRCVGKSIFLMSGRRRLNCVKKCGLSYCLIKKKAAYLQQLVNIHYSTPALVKEISSRPIPLGNPNTGLEWKEKRTHHFHP